MDWVSASKMKASTSVSESVVTESEVMVIVPPDVEMEVPPEPAKVNPVWAPVSRLTVFLYILHEILWSAFFQVKRMD